MRVFISYARRDAAFAERLSSALVKRELEPLLDAADIAPGELWRDRLDALILGSDAVAFVLSREWAESRICAWELSRAVEFGKVLAPALWRPMPLDLIPKALAARNFVSFNSRTSKKRAFKDGVDKLVAALRVDHITWRREQTRLLRRAIEWRASGFLQDRLLGHGESAKAAEWAAEKPPEADEIPALLVEYLAASAAAGTALDRVGNVIAGIERRISTLQDTILPSLKLVSSYEDLPLDQIYRLPTALLVAEYGKIPFNDDRHLKTELLSWANDVGDTPLSGRLYAAPAGFGKTRLLLETIVSLAEAGWRAGFLPRTTFEAIQSGGDHDVDEGIERIFAERGEAGVLLALDYAESRRGQIERLTRAALRAPTGGPIRLVLLTRGTGEWWETLLKESRDIERVFDSEPVTAIAQPVSPEHRLAFFLKTSEALGELLEAAMRSKEPDGREALVPPDWRHRSVATNRLAAEGVGSPLSLAFEAFLHVRGVEARETPLIELAREERRHWARAMKLRPIDVARIGEPRIDAMHRAVATLTLTQGEQPSSPDRIDAELDRVLDIALGEALLLVTAKNAAARARVYAQIRAGVERLYRDRRGGLDRLRPVLPDVLGEHVVIGALAYAPTLLADLLQSRPQVATTALSVSDRMTTPPHVSHEHVHKAIRAALDRSLADIADAVVTVGYEQAGLVPEIAAETLDQMAESGRRATADAVLAAVPRDTGGSPYRSVTLRSLLSTAAAILRETGDSRADPVAQGRKDLYLGVLLSGGGRRKEALAAALDGVKALRLALAANPDDAEIASELYRGLGNLANSLRLTGKLVEARAIGEESIAGFRAIAAIETAPDSMMTAHQGIRIALINHASTLSDMGEHEDALRIITEAIRIAHAFRGEDVEDPVGVLAKTYEAAAIIASRTDEAREQPVDYANAAVSLLANLPEEERNEHLEELASALNTLSNRLAEAGEFDDALPYLYKATDVRRALARRNPSAFKDDLAVSLDTLSAHLMMTDRANEAEPYNNEAIAIRREQVLSGNKRARQGLAKALTNGAVIHSAARRYSTAIDFAQEAFDENLAYHDAVDGADIESDIGKAIDILTISVEKEVEEDPRRALGRGALARRIIAKAAEQTSPLAARIRAGLLAIAFEPVLRQEMVPPVWTAFLLRLAERTRTLSFKDRRLRINRAAFELKLSIECMENDFFAECEEAVDRSLAEYQAVATLDGAEIGSDLMTRFASGCGWHGRVKSFLNKNEEARRSYELGIEMVGRIDSKDEKAGLAASLRRSLVDDLAKLI